MKKIACYVFFAFSSILITTLFVVDLFYAGSVRRFGISLLLFLLGFIFILFRDDLLGDDPDCESLAREIVPGGGLLALFFAGFFLVSNFLS